MPGRIARASPRRGVTALACAALIALSYHFSSPSGRLRQWNLCARKPPIRCKGHGTGKQTFSSSFEIVLQ
eukprot:5995121-Amphidinium_carterae.1